MQALARLVSQLSKIFEADGCIHEAAENEASCVRFATEKACGRFVEQRFGSVKNLLFFSQLA